MRMMLVEDCASDADAFKRHLLRYCIDRDVAVELVVLDDGTPLAGGMPGDVDAFFLDIEMPGTDGLEIARMIRAADGAVPICFVTNLGSLALEGYEVDAIGFLVKPICPSSFYSVMDRIARRVARRCRDLVTFQNGRLEWAVDIGLVPFVETINRKTIVHVFDDGKPSSFQVRESLNAMEARLARPCLFRVHSAYLVNMDHIASVAASDVVVAGQTIPVSKHRRKDLMQALTRRIGSGLK